MMFYYIFLNIKIKELERMYQDILRVIDTEKNSLDESTNSAESSTSISSFNNSTGELAKTKGRNYKNKLKSSRVESQHQNDINDIK